MKKLLYGFICILFFVLLSSACTPADISDDDVIGSGGFTTVPREIKRMDYTKEESAEILNKTDKFTLSDDFIAHVPKSLNYISSYTISYPAAHSGQETFNEFMEAFEYFFPNHQYDDKYMLVRLSADGEYRYSNEYDADGNLIDPSFSDPQFKEDFLSGKVYNFWILYYNESDKETDDNKVCMAFTAPLGADYFTVNKGVTRKIMYQRGLDEIYRVSDNLTLSDWYATEKVFEPEDELPPDSDKRFVLQDGKEISVKEAAAFFENYLNSVKTTTDPMFKNKVVSVTPYRFFDDNTYILHFQNTEVYNEIPFDSTQSGTTNVGGAPRYGMCLNYGVMSYTDDVDYFYGDPVARRVRDETEITDFVSFEEAVAIAAEKLTDYTDFRIDSADLVYCPEMAVNIDTQEEMAYSHTIPAWRFDLYNPNDGLNYICYVSAADGSFWYHKTRNQ